MFFQGVHIEGKVTLVMFTLKSLIKLKQQEVGGLKLTGQNLDSCLNVSRKLRNTHAGGKRTLSKLTTQSFLSVG